MNTVAIYCRVSTLEQKPESQINDCIEYAKQKGYEINEEYIFIERLSGFKDIERPKYEEVKQLAKDRKIKGVVVWAFDRWVRRRDTLIDDITILSLYGVKLHSVKDSWLELINIEGPIGKTLREFLLGLVGSLSEMESQRKSERVKLAFERIKRENRIYKRWGRHSIPERAIEEVKTLARGGLTIREISKRVIYYDKNNKPKNLSIGFVHKTISQKEILN